MERRINKRRRTETKVYLHHPKLPTAPFSTRDLSAGGVFVETPNAYAIPVDTRLEMTFAVDLGNVTRLYDFEVTVVRRCQEGLGLLIDRSRPSRNRAVPRRVHTRHPAKILPLARK